MGKKNKASTKPTFQLIPLNIIDDPEAPMRDDLTPESVGDLVSSIKQVGLIEPVVVRPKKNRFEVIAGHRRLLACKIVPLPEVPSYVMNVDDASTDQIKLHENFYRKDIDPIEEGRFLVHMRDKYNYSLTELAKVVGMSESYVKQRVAIFDYPDDILVALKESVINFSVARELANISDDDVRGMYLTYAVENGVTPAVAAQWRREWATNQQTGSPDTPKNPDEAPSSIPIPHSVACAICQESVFLKDAKLLYAHHSCWTKINTPTE